MEQTILKTICHHPIYLALDYIKGWHKIADYSTKQTNLIMAFNRHVSWVQTEWAGDIFFNPQLILTSKYKANLELLPSTRIFSGGKYLI